jgi:DNA (cytosine-5)-methyltransferase 1
LRTANAECNDWKTKKSVAVTNSNHFSPKCFAEFFAGIGLMRMGLAQAGWRVAFANDIDEDKQQMYRDQFGAGEEFVLGDVHKLNATEVPDIALATASFPCNDLSLVGARRGLEGEQSSAFWGFMDVLTKMGVRRPPMELCF